MAEGPTQVALLTPAGRGAVATVAVSGAHAISFVEQCFYPAAERRPAGLPLDRVRFGRWASDTGEELVVCRTGDHSVEVHCHGGQAAAAAVVGSLVELGAVEVTWQFWLARQENLLSAEAARALADARTERTAAVLLDQYRGALAAEIDRLASLLGQGQGVEAQALTEALLARAPCGLHLTTPWRVVLAGLPNVGKSSLLNALVGYERALVYDHPGTTRDVLRAVTACEGWPVELADTAGAGETHDALAAASHVQTTAAVSRADLVLHVVEAGSSAAECPPAAYSAPVLTVVNKCDLLATLPPPAAHTVCVSARTRSGLAELFAAIARQLVPSPPLPGAGVPFVERHRTLLESVSTCLKAGDIPAAAQACRDLAGEGDAAPAAPQTC